MRDVDTLGAERLLIAAAGDEAVSLCVTHPRFGRVAAVRLDLSQTRELVAALRQIGSNGLA
jgi:hypothetical protein